MSMSIHTSLLKRKAKHNFAINHTSRLLRVKEKKRVCWQIVRWTGMKLIWIPAHLKMLVCAFAVKLLMNLFCWSQRLESSLHWCQSDWCLFSNKTQTIKRSLLNNRGAWSLTKLLMMLKLKWGEMYRKFSGFTAKRESKGGSSLSTNQVNLHNGRKTSKI